VCSSDLAEGVFEPSVGELYQDEAASLVHGKQFVTGTPLSHDEALSQISTSKEYVKMLADSGKVYEPAFPAYKTSLRTKIDIAVRNGQVSPEEATKLRKDHESMKVVNGHAEPNVRGALSALVADGKDYAIHGDWASGTLNKVLSKYDASSPNMGVAQKLVSATLSRFVEKDAAGKVTIKDSVGYRGAYVALLAELRVLGFSPRGPQPAPVAVAAGPHHHD
jgi:hypothetical protein